MFKLTWGCISLALFRFAKKCFLTFQTNFTVAFINLLYFWIILVVFSKNKKPPHDIVNGQPHKLAPVWTHNHNQCSFFPSTWFWNPLLVTHLQGRRIQIVGGARCSLRQTVLKLDSLWTSVEVCWLKRENVPQSSNVSFTLAIVTSDLCVRLFSRW